MNPLTIYPKHPSAPDTYHINGAWTPACITAVEKRFSEAELMAEAHRAVSLEYAAKAEPRRYKPGAEKRTALQAEIFHRFATLPHYDENPA